MLNLQLINIIVALIALLVVEPLIILIVALGLVAVSVSAADFRLNLSLVNASLKTACTPPFHSETRGRYHGRR